jgi:hypothetical protein
MTRKQLEEAISTLEYLVLNHRDPEKVAAFKQELDDYRQQACAFDQPKTQSAAE